MDIAAEESFMRLMEAPSSSVLTQDTNDHAANVLSNLHLFVSRLEVCKSLIGSFHFLHFINFNSPCYYK
jgi:hypothetical protein